jgi:hypothetical protein
MVAACANTWPPAGFFGSVMNMPPPGSAITGTQKETHYDLKLIIMTSWNRYRAKQNSSPWLVMYTATLNSSAILVRRDSICANFCCNIIPDTHKQEEDKMESFNFFTRASK